MTPVDHEQPSATIPRDLCGTDSWFGGLASAVPEMLVNGRSENALFFDGIFFESSLKSIFFAS